MIIWFGFGLLPKVLVIALATFFPMAIGLIEGFASTEREARCALLRSMGASRWQQFRYVRLPSALPRFFTALRIGITYAVVGAVFAEYVGASEGLGIYMACRRTLSAPTWCWRRWLVTAVISIALFLLDVRGGAGRGPVVTDGAGSVRHGSRCLSRDHHGSRCRASTSRPSSSAAGQHASGRRCVLRPGRIRLGHRPQRLRQEHAVQPRRRARAAEPGRSRRHGRVSPALSPTCRRRTCCSRGDRSSTTPRSGSRCRGSQEGGQARARELFPVFGLDGFETPPVRSCPAACASGRRCCGRSCRTASCCCSTSRSARWTR